MNKWHLERDALLRRWYGRVPQPLRTFGRAWPKPIQPTDYLMVPPPQADAHNCQIWRGKLSKAGYGHLLLDGQSLLAHRTAYLQENGPLSRELVLRHSCHRPYCIQPEHMYTGKPANHFPLPPIFELPHFNLFSTPDTPTNIPRPMVVQPNHAVSAKTPPPPHPLARTATIHHSLN